MAAPESISSQPVKIFPIGGSDLRRGWIYSNLFKQKKAFSFDLYSNLHHVWRRHRMGEGGGLLVGLVKPELGKQPNKAQLILKSFVSFHTLSLLSFCICRYLSPSSAFKFFVPKCHRSSFLCFSISLTPSHHTLAANICQPCRGNSSGAYWDPFWVESQALATVETALFVKKPKWDWILCFTLYLVDLFPFPCLSSNQASSLANC